MNVIPKATWTIAGIVYAATAALLLFLMSRNPSDFGNWPGFGRALLAFGFPILLFLYVVLIGYVYGDSRRRGMRHVMWTLLVMFIPNAIGFILYFILREPILSQCSQCGADLGRGFTYCAKCGTPRAQTCPQCHRQVEPGWVHCSHCGTRL
jgi:hypothetical protein